ncbi:linker for activation of T-cells family member 1 isoform X1 [Oryctolagus cuniculus]|uniref:linker for activation of T-cells family member 1 isoform X1 n=1 Tax=Oryctolagus cuniculus TaxID=9986 RepID=UPI0038791FCF
MEVNVLGHSALGLLLGPLLAVLLMALCVRCRRLSDSYNSASSSDGLYPRSILIKPPYTPAPWPAVTSVPPLSQPDLLPIPRSPQPPGDSHRMPSSRRDSGGAQSVASYENEGAFGLPGAAGLGGPAGWGGGGLSRAVLSSPHPVSLPAELACEDADEDEDEEDSHNEGYLEVLPDDSPATSGPGPSAPAPGNPGLRDSAFSMESGDDYVNVPESGGSADASLDGSREYVNVSQELPLEARIQPATLSAPEAGDQEEDEEAPDYENLQGLN